MGRLAELQEVMREINNVRAPIAQHTIAIEVEGAPIEWMIQLVARFHLRRPAPEIPVQGLGLFLSLGEDISTASVGVQWDDKLLIGSITDDKIYVCQLGE